MFLKNKQYNIVFLLLFISFSFSAMERRLINFEMIEQLSNNPCAFSREVDTIERDFLKEGNFITECFKKSRLTVEDKDIKDYLRFLNGIYNASASQHPLFLLGECDEETCQFNRSNNPRIRHSYETSIINKLIAEIGDKNQEKTVTVTSFACGFCLPDFVILTEVLKEKPNACIDIHFIDECENHSTYIESIRLCIGLSQEVTNIHHINNIVNNRKIILQSFQDKYNNRVSLTDKELFSMIGICFNMEKRYQQIREAIHKLYPQSNCRIFVHDAIDSYLTYITTHNLSHADVLMATDIKEELGNGLSHFKELCEKTLESKKKPHIAFLAENDNDVIYKQLEKLKTK